MENETKGLKQIDRINKAYARNTSFSNSKDENFDNAARDIEGLKYFELARNTKSTIECVFDYADSKSGNLSVKNVDGITIVCENDGKNPVRNGKDGKASGMLTGVPVNVKVNKIDFISNTVYVIEDRREGLLSNGSILKAIYHGLQKNETVEVKGQVVSVKETYAIVNLYGKGIFGIVYLNDWSEEYIRSMHDVCSVDDIVPFYVTKSADSNRSNRPFFKLKGTEKNNTWSKLSDDLFHKGDACLVTCVERTNKGYWWGKTSRAEGIEVFCDYNQKLTIVEGNVYKCNVIDYRPADKIFKVTPFAVSTAGSGGVRFSKKMLKSRNISSEVTSEVTSEV